MRSISTTSRALHRLLSVADVVIEASRPAALRRRGLGRTVAPRAARCGCTSPGTAPTRQADGWPSVTTRRCPVGWSNYHGTGPMLAGDAIADHSPACARRMVTESLGPGRRPRPDRGVDGGDGGPLRRAGRREHSHAPRLTGRPRTRPRRRQCPGADDDRERVVRVMLIRRATLLDGSVVDIQVGTGSARWPPR